MKPSATLAALLENFFTQRLMNQRQASPHTIRSYRDTFRLLLQSAQRRTAQDAYPPGARIASQQRASQQDPPALLPSASPTHMGAPVQPAADAPPFHQRLRGVSPVLPIRRPAARRPRRTRVARLFRTSRLRSPLLSSSTWIYSRGV